MTEFSLQTPPQTVEAVVELLEADLPGWIWGVGRCRCESEEGPYACILHSPDHVSGAYAITPNGLVAVEAGHFYHSHGRTPLEALSRAYGQAVGHAL